MAEIEKLVSESIGWEELANEMMDALCNAMGDSKFQAWLKKEV